MALGWVLTLLQKSSLGLIFREAREQVSLGTGVLRSLWVMHEDRDWEVGWQDSFAYLLFPLCISFTLFLSIILSGRKKENKIKSVLG